MSSKRITIALLAAAALVLATIEAAFTSRVGGAATDAQAAKPAAAPAADVTIDSHRTDPNARSTACCPASLPRTSMLRLEPAGLNVNHVGVLGLREGYRKQDPRAVASYREGIASD